MLLKLVKGVMRLIRWVLSLSVTLVLIVIGVYIYARYIEPELLIVKEQVVTTQSISLSKQPLKIVQFSDVHLGLGFTNNHLNKVVERINKLEPDLIIFTGDLIDDNKEFTQVEETAAILKKLKATYGKFAVYGNHDHGGNGTKRYAKILTASDFHLLVNESEWITLENGQRIHLIGIDDKLLGKVDIDKAMKGIQKSAYNIFISHAPDVADEVLSYPIDLQLSGHSHGGQVRIPFIGAPFTPPYGNKYVKGKYTFENNRRMTLYVNSGIGTSQMRYRFGNIPEITCLIIKNE